MRKQVYIALLLAGTLGGAVRADEVGAACGDSGMVCGETEKCCAHTVAYYSPDGVQGASHTEGQCIAKADKCSAFWCGPQHCQAGFFSTPKVCCIDPRPGGAPEYQCARTELNCPGNTGTLMIRESRADTSLDRS